MECEGHGKLDAFSSAPVARSPFEFMQLCRDHSFYLIPCECCFQLHFSLTPFRSLAIFYACPRISREAAQQSCASAACLLVR
mmetsp:Transcript_873/g.1927  ORF Transcript_873/g.1927 Transcript_873/m.1927 type:complete len:82 (-) Transcript_873:239-484(-)